MNYLIAVFFIWLVWLGYKIYREKDDSNASFKGKEKQVSFNKLEPSRHFTDNKYKGIGVESIKSENMNSVKNLNDSRLKPFK